MKLITRLAIIAMLLLPLFGVGMHNYRVEQEIWVVTTDDSDIDLNLAISTFRHQIANTHIDVNEILLSELGVLESDVDALVLVGHGQPDGLETADGIIPWVELYDGVQDFKPQMMMVLACYSPSYPEERIFGFTGQIDAEAGAILTAYVVGQTLGISGDISISTERILGAQQTMLHPLGSVLYFVHGYFGDIESWRPMKDYLEANDELLLNYDHVRYFNYSEYWLNENPDWDIDDVHTECTIYDFATRFVQDIIEEGFGPGTQIDIVSHSMGGLITRELLRLYRSDLQDSHNIDIGRVVTLGTPHLGTHLADGTPPSYLLLYIMSLWGTNWNSLLLETMSPSSDFITTLNENPSSYSDDILWTTISGYDYILGALLLIFHGGYNDNVVADWSAHLSFSDSHYLMGIDHDGLLIDLTNSDPDRPFDIVAEALGPEIDSDNDGLSDIEERLVYGTDPDASDSDSDGLDDNSEINTYGTDPLDDDSDNDGINDGLEVNSHGTNPNESDTDGDTLSDYDEIYFYLTDPNNWDSDSDTMPDAWEIQYNLNPLTNDATGDPDVDGLINLGEYQYSTDPNNSDSDNDGLNDYYEIFVHNTDPNDSDTDDDTLSDYAEIYTHGTYPTYWSSDGDILSDAQEIAWGYDPHDPDDPIPADNLIYLSKDIKGMTGYVRANHYAAMDYVKVYVRYKTSSGYWTSYSYVGLDSTPYYSGDYYVSWSIPQGYVQMKVKVNAYDSSDHYLGSDITYVTLPDDGGGGGPLPD